jgi:predicted AAA+ superfamily ATPase
MKRVIFNQLLEWKEKENRKPLILQGARQVGKSYIVKEFGQKHFKNFVKVDFLSQKEFHLIFNKDESLKAKDILKHISLLIGESIVPNETLLFFDEIQECPGALTSLKYFEEEMPELAVISAGSYLGIMVHESSYPVGKVEFLKMYPMNFQEFLQAFNEELYSYYKIFKINLEDLHSIPEIYHQKFIEVWRMYLFIGGMPEAVKIFIQNKSELLTGFTEARKIQQQLITGYQSDFAKHSGPVNATHILNVFDSVAIQLAQTHNEEVKKFSFSDAIPQKRGFANIRGPLTWLVKSHLVIQNLIVNKAEHPLKAFAHDNKFKLYYFDVGLLGAALDLPPESLLKSTLGAYKGFIAENFVASEFMSVANSPFYSWQESKAELEFLIIKNGDICPVEVKSSEKSIRSKSLESFIGRYRPVLSYKLTPKNLGYNIDKKTLTLPIYLSGKIFTKNS